MTRIMTITGLAAFVSVLVFTDAVPAQRPLPLPTSILSPPAVTVPIQTPATVEGAPWANKMFLADIKKNPGQTAPPELEYDFGTVAHGTVASQKFIITNIYDVPIQVIDVRRECGCLTAYPPQKVLQPNEEAEFTVTMNTGVFPNAGDIRKTLYVTFGNGVVAANNPKLVFVSTATIRFKAVSRKDITVTPGQLDFGIVVQGDKKTLTTQVKYAGSRRDWKVTGALPPTGPIEVEVKEATRGFLGAEYWLTVTLKPDMPAGQLSETVVLKTNDPAMPSVNVTVLGLIQAPVTVAPGKVEFRGVKVGEFVTQKVMLKAATAFTVQGLVDEDNGITVKPMLASSAPLQLVEVRFEPKKTGRVLKELKLKTTLGNGIIVPLSIDAESGG